MESSRDRTSHRSSRHSRSPSRRREPERRRSSSRLPAAHFASRSSSHRQPENRWTRSQERSSGGAVSPAPSDDDAYQPFDRVRVLYLLTVSCVQKRCNFFGKQRLTAYVEAGRHSFCMMSQCRQLQHSDSVACHVPMCICLSSA